MVYKVSRKFTSGILKGITYTETTSVAMEVGFKCKNPIGGSSYIIVSCEKV